MVLETAIPLTVIVIIAIVVVFFIIKSLIKFAIIAGAIALIVFIAWQFGAFDFLASYVPPWSPWNPWA